MKVMCSITESPKDDLGPVTTPENFQLSVLHCDDEDLGRMLGLVVGEWVQLISTVFDLSSLDGVTIAYNYKQALLELDRGYISNQKLEPTDGHAVGVAMTPLVLRNELLKSHIVLNAWIVEPILDEDHQNHQLILHSIAHECAHVEVNHKFETIFPGLLLRKQEKNLRDGFRWQTILACWNEYAVTRLCGHIGASQTEKYEEILFQYLEDARGRANASIKAYRTHHQLTQVYAEVYGIYGELLKFSAYYLGDLDSHGLVAPERELYVRNLSGHWFEPFFLRLHRACKDLSKSYGEWLDLSPFEAIGDIADDLVELGGIHAKYIDDGTGVYLNIPYSPETMPD